MGRHEAAAEHFRRAVAINNQHVETYVGLAMAMRRLPQRAAHAAEVIASAARISKNSAVLVAQIGGLALARQDKTAEAPTTSEIRREWIEDQLDRDGIILAQHPGWNDVRVRSALLQRLAGESAAAMELLRAALLQDPSCNSAWMQLGLLFADGGETDKAISAFESALALDARMNELEYRVGLVYCNRMEFDLAMERIETWGVEGSDIQRRVWVAIDGMRMEPPKPSIRRQPRSVSVGQE
jgi:tetratricopeptide (TPR) repeat protein